MLLTDSTVTLICSYYDSGADVDKSSSYVLDGVSVYLGCLEGSARQLDLTDRRPDCGKWQGNDHPKMAGQHPGAA